MDSVSQLIRRYENILALELDLVRTALRHSLQKGSALETAVSTLLQQFLPESIGVTEGVVVDSSGFVSKQLDLILYDRSAAQLFFKSDATKVVPAEFVFAIGEVKAVLDKAGYDRFQASQKEVKDTHRYYLRHENIGNLPYTYHGYGREWTMPPIASFIVAFEAADNAYDWAIESRLTHAENDCIDAIVSPEAFSIHRATAEFGPDLVQGKLQSLDKVTTEPLFVFLGMLAKAAAHWRILENVAIYRYFHGVSFPNSLITPLPMAVVKHPYLKGDVQ